jgi:hypothetical protein
MFTDSSKMVVISIIPTQCHAPEDIFILCLFQMYGYTDTVVNSTDLLDVFTHVWGTLIYRDPMILANKCQEL